MYEQKDGGAFWWATDKTTGEFKKTKKGDRYMTGKLTINGQTVNACLFYNKDKTNEKGPDINISINEKQAGTTPEQEAFNKAAAANGGYPGEEPIKVEDIPF